MKAESAPKGAPETVPGERNGQAQDSATRGLRLVPNEPPPHDWHISDADRERGLRNIAELRKLSAARRSGTS